MDELGHKIIALFVILITIFVSTALPIKLEEWFKSKGRIGQVIISAVMCFGGGFFLGTFLLHTTPEVQEHVTKYITIPYKIDYPLPYLIIGGGFFLMLFMEKAVMELLAWNDKRKLRNTWSMDVESTRNTSPGGPNLIALKPVHETNGVIGGDLHKERNEEREKEAAIAAAEASCSTGINPSGEVFSEGHGHGHSHSEVGGHSHAHGSAAKSIVLLLALSLDCVFEGLSLGLQDSIQGVWQMVVAILSHEIVVAFSLGLQLIHHNPPLKTLGMAFTYGVTCPVGIAIGIGIYEGAANLDNFNIVYGILLGITAGVFLYVTFFEILMHEFITGAKMINILAVFLGFGIMAGIMTTHNHSHHHDYSAK